MRPFCLSLCLLSILPAAAATAAASAAPVAGAPISPACNVASIDPAASGEPPAWLLLASAIALLAAGRLAGSGAR